MSWTLGQAFGICGLGMLVQIIIFYYFNFCCLVTYNFSQSLIHKKNYFSENSPGENILCISFCVKERERNIEQFTEHGLVCFVSMLQIILYWEADIREFQSTTDYVRDEIYFKEIVSNTRLYLNHLSFTHLVCEFLIICRFHLIYTISIYCFCLSHLFVLLLIFRFVCCSFYFITKVYC